MLRLKARLHPQSAIFLQLKIQYTLARTSDAAFGARSSEHSSVQAAAKLSEPEDAVLPARPLGLVSVYAALQSQSPM